MEYTLELIKTLFGTRKFISISSLKDGVKKTYTLTGAKTIWKKEPNIVYSYQLRVTGSKTEFGQFIKGLSNDILKDLNQFDDNIKAKTTKANLNNTLITNQNYTENELYQHEVEEYNKLKKTKPKKDKYTIEQIYEAFLVYKENKDDIGPRKTPVKLNNLGEIYKSLEGDQVLNVFNYSSKDPQIKIERVEDPNDSKFRLDGKVMYRVPNYRLVSSKRNDVQSALKDLVALNVIELGKKQITALLKEWAQLKTKQNGKIASPKKLGDKGIEMPQTIKHKIKVVN